MQIKIQQPRQDSTGNFNFNFKYGHFYVWLRGIGHISSWFDRHILYLTPHSSAGLRLAEHIYIAHILGVGCNPTSRTSFFQGTPPKNTHTKPLTFTQSTHTFSTVHQKIRTLSGSNFERQPRSREKDVETLEHCFRSPPLTTITHKTCGHVCSPPLWLPRPAVYFA
jgi:hypothetical protein